MTKLHGYDVSIGLATLAHMFQYNKLFRYWLCIVLEYLDELVFHYNQICIYGGIGARKDITLLIRLLSSCWSQRINNMSDYEYNELVIHGKCCTGRLQCSCLRSTVWLIINVTPFWFQWGQGLILFWFQWGWGLTPFWFQWGQGLRPFWFQDAGTRFLHPPDSVGYSLMPFWFQWGHSLLPYWF